MSTFHDRFGISGNGHARNGAEDHVDPCCPILGASMLPKMDPATGYCEVPAFKLTVFREGERFKAVVGAGPSFKRFFLTLSGLEGIGEQIEAALSGSGGEWVEPKSPKVPLQRPVK